MSCSKVEGDHKDCISRPTFSESIFKAPRYVPNLKPAPNAEATGQAVASLVEGLMVYFSMLSVQCSVGGSLSRMVSSIVTVPWAQDPKPP